MMDKYFIEVVESNNYSRVRYALSNELLIDPRGDVFHEMLAYAESKMEGLFVKDNGKRSEEDPSRWDDNFLFTVKNELDKNFSREKLLYYEHVAKQVLKSKARQLDEMEKEQTEPHEGNCEQQSGNKVISHKKQIYIGVTIGGAILTTVGICISKVAITTLGIASIAIGGYQLYNEYKKNNI